MQLVFLLKKIGPILLMEKCLNRGFLGY